MCQLGHIIYLGIFRNCKWSTHSLTWVVLLVHCLWIQVKVTHVHNTPQDWALRLFPPPEKILRELIFLMINLQRCTCSACFHLNEKRLIYLAIFLSVSLSISRSIAAPRKMMTNLSSQQPCGAGWNYLHSPDGEIEVGISKVTCLRSCKKLVSEPGSAKSFLDSQTCAIIPVPPNSFLDPWQRIDKSCCLNPAPLHGGANLTVVQQCWYPALLLEQRAAKHICPGKGAAGGEKKGAAFSVL